MPYPRLQCAVVIFFFFCKIHNALKSTQYFHTMGIILQEVHPLCDLAVYQRKGCRHYLHLHAPTYSITQIYFIASYSLDHLCPLQHSTFFLLQWNFLSFSCQVFLFQKELLVLQSGTGMTILGKTKLHPVLPVTNGTTN